MIPGTRGDDRYVGYRVIVPATHDPRLVVLSIVVSILGALAAIDLMERVRDARGRSWLPWLIAAATADAIGTWSIHYTAKLGLRLPSALQLDWRVVVLSFLVGVAGSGAALLLIGRKAVPLWRAVPAGILLGGIGISGLHYTAMGAIQHPRMHHYHSPALVALSIVVAVVISCISLPLTFRLSGDTKKRRLFRTYASSLIRGLANPAMHYIAMVGVVFIYPRTRPELVHTVSIASLGVIGITIVPVMVLVVAMLTSLVDRLQKQRTVLDELFEQTPEAVAVTRSNGEIVRVNREFTRLFGYAPHEAIGKRLDTLIGGPEFDSSARERLLVAGVRRRKDGTRLDVSGVRVPVFTNNKEAEIYVLLRDVTEQKRAEEALRAFPRKLIETQETERQRIARELHDEIGQMLTGAGMLLGSKENLPPDAHASMDEARSVLRDLTTRVRNLALDLRPPMLHDFGLVHALNAFLQRYERQTGIRVDVEHTGVEGRRFGAEIEITAYRIVQEALTNVARHADVPEVAVRLSADDTALRIEVADRGAGFDDATRAQNTIGLAGMHERAMFVGGALTVTSSPGGGTRIEAVLPFRTVEERIP